MSVTNHSNCNRTSNFILSGIPGLEDFNFWMGFPLISIYIIVILGNVSMLYIIKVDKELHQPMYIFLSMLSMIELLIATTTMPKMLGIFWMHDREIAFNICLAQIFFIPFLSALESGILLAMAFDRFVAICHPLRYSSILTSQKICEISAMVLVRGALGLIPFPLLIQRFPLWKNIQLTHSYCLHQEVMHLACGDIRPNIIYGLFIILSIMGIDSLFISFSYMLIIKTVLGLVEESSLKVFSTCASHICAVLVFYIPLIGLSVVHRFKNNTMPNLHILFGDVYVLLPPLINPLIYGIKTKQIRLRLKKLYGKIINCGNNSRKI